MKDDAVQKVEPTFLTQYLDEDTSTDALNEYRVLTRVKVLQALSDTELKEEFGEGGVILSPGNALVAPKGEAFEFVPLFFFAEFCLWSDRDDPGTPAILERSFDPSSEICKKARDPNSRVEAYGDNDQFERRYVEHLNFAGVIYGEHPLANTPCVLSFSRGEFGQGSNFISAIKLRKVAGRQAPIWSQVWSFSSAFRDLGPKKRWFGLDFASPGQPYIDEKDAEDFHNLYLGLKEDHEKARLVVDHSEGEDTAEPVDTSEDADY